MKVLASLFTAAGLLAAATAQAGFVYVDQVAPARSTFPLPSNNYFQSQLAAAGVTTESFGASLGLNAGGNVRVDYFGNEAAFINRFVWDGQTVATTPGTLVDPWGARYVGTFAAGAGVLPVSFCTQGGSGTGTQGGVPPSCVGNAESDARAPGALNGISYFVSADGNTAWMLWDDGGGGPDDNHDDMMVRLTYSVPEPAPLGLMGLGLAAVGFGRRRRKA